ncbi:hypothetical protein SNEBB_002447 [Seison nebaliae]|nr:hypothetical protein SNEBB_002447 [Seison nebaliae]
MSILFTIIFISSSINLAFSLECYTCDNEVFTITNQYTKRTCRIAPKSCAIEQDTCLSVVEWKIRPNSIRGERSYYVTKSCGTKVDCEKMRDRFEIISRRNRNYDRIYVDCCSGDECNLNVRLKASSLSGNFVIISILAFIVISSQKMSGVSL